MTWHLVCFGCKIILTNIPTMFTYKGYKQRTSFTPENRRIDSTAERRCQMYVAVDIRLWILLFIQSLSMRGSSWKTVTVQRDQDSPRSLTGSYLSLPTTLWSCDTRQPFQSLKKRFRLISDSWLDKKWGVGLVFCFSLLFPLSVRDPESLMRELSDPFPLWC